MDEPNKDGPNKGMIAIGIVAFVLITGVCLYMVFTGQMDSRTYLQIGVAIGLLGLLVRAMRS